MIQMTLSTATVLLFWSFSIGLAFTPQSSSCSSFAPDAYPSTTRQHTRINGIFSLRSQLTHIRTNTRRPLFRPQHDDGGDASTTTQALSRSAKAPPTKSSGEGRGGGGGWGSWTNVVSQREEQENVLKKLHVNTDAELATSGLRVRTVVKGDMPRVSHLCVETFRGPYEWYMLPFQLLQEFIFFGQINARLGLLTRNEIKHSMVVVEDTTSSRVVGFLEIGMLPRPTRSEQGALASTDTSQIFPKHLLLRHMADETGQGGTGDVETNSKAAPGGLWQEAAKASGRKDVHVIASGDILEDPMSSADDVPKSKAKQPDAAYLANVVVAKKQRRRGIGRMMVESAMEIVKELWPDEERIYVTVEKGNDIAVALYTGMGFEFAALEDDMMARSRRRAPRIYLSKTVASLD